MAARLFHFLGGSTGPWRVVEMNTIAGDAIATVAKLNVVGGELPTPPSDTRWTLRGMTSNERYVNRAEKGALLASQPALGRPEATRAAMILVRKSTAWWSLTQDERRHVLEEQSRHIQIGLKYLPAVARRLHHCRDLGEHEPFDFITWFEFAPADAAAFDTLTAELRSSPEWRFVDREIDLRLVRDSN